VIQKFIESWKNKSTDDELADILSWVEEKNKNIKVKITKNRLSDSQTWYYDEQSGQIRNQNKSFFQIQGIQQYGNEKLVLEQPILLQNEIGYLGIICKEIGGVLCFLMQAKIEPGNINKIQISPTIQATKSNFMQKHGGAKPAYLEYFLNADKYKVVFDQIQSEQSSRFLGKRNRNIMIMVDEDVEILSSHRWMTLGTIKQLMCIDNLVNMDTRTVLSCIPFSMFYSHRENIQKIKRMFSNDGLIESMFEMPSYEDVVKVYHYLNEYKMLHGKESKLIPLKDMQSWVFTDYEIVNKKNYPFKVVFCDIEIEGREVTHWTQPLFEAIGIATFGLMITKKEGKMKFLVHALSEVGCFDAIELAPTVQREAGKEDKQDVVTEIFFQRYAKGLGIVKDVILSEEGGRVFQEQNKNVIMEIPENMIETLPKGYFWLDYCTLNQMVQFNNVLNIQLRNLLSLLGL